MAYNTKEIVKDKDGNPISQYYNPATDKYEPVIGAGGGNAVVLYNADGTENNSLSLIPILDKLSQLTGTVVDEETRKSNESQRVAFYNQLQQMLADGDLKGDKGDIGLGLEFKWTGTELGVRVKGQTNYVYVNLKGEKGDKGDPGVDVIDNLTSTDTDKALSAKQGKVLKDTINNLDISTDAENISYDNTESELEAENVQEAIDIIVGNYIWFGTVETVPEP